MTETFNLPLKVGASGSEKLGVNKVQFGDGYESRASNGLNNQTSEWSVSITGDNEKLIPYIEFIANHGGVRSFYWTPPTGEQGLFTAEEWKTDTLGAGIYTLSTTFTRTYSAGPIETRSINIVEGSGALIDDTKPSLASVYSSSKTEEVIDEKTSAAISNLQEQSNPFSQYAKKSDLDSVKTTADAAATQIELKKTNDKVAGLEKVKPVLSVNGTEPDQSGNITITVSGDATEQINSAIDSLKKEDDPFTQYAKETDLEAVKETADNAATKIEVSAIDKKVKSLEVMKPVLMINDESPDDKGNVNIASEINDKATATDSTWSSQKISDNVDEKLKDLEGLPKKVGALETYKDQERFTIIYPNSGTEANPANIVGNSYYVINNPFPDDHIICVAEILVNGDWGDAGWIYAGNNTFGTRASSLNKDKIIVRTGSGRIMPAAQDSGSSFPNGTPVLTTAPCRVKVWRVA